MELPPATLTSTHDPVSQLLVATIIGAVFVFLAFEAAHRVLVVFVAVALLWGITYLTPYRLITFEASQQALDLNVLLLLASMMAVVGVLKTTGVFGWAVGEMLHRTGGRPIVIQTTLLWFTAILSSLVDNVTTVVFTTPMALAMAGALSLPAGALLMPMIMAANIGGTATLIGDPPNILIGSAAGIPFTAFLLNLAIPVGLMLFGLEALSRGRYRGALGRATQRVGHVAEEGIVDPRLLRWALGISGLIFVGFLTHGLTGMPAAVPAAIGAAILLAVQDILYLRRHRPSATERVHGMLEVLEKEIEWPTLSFFAFLFIAVGAAVQTGLIETAAGGLEWIIHAGSAAGGLTPDGTLLFAALVILWTAGVMSALIDNIPFVAVSIPIVATLVTTLSGDTVILWWALALGACLGGNGSPIGASANVTVIGLAEREGQRIAFSEFVRFGVPVTLFTLLVGSAFVSAHVLWGAGATRSVGFGLLLLVAFIRWMGRSRRQSS